eukprot:3103822-Rhodomonas_salina.1
MDKSFLLSLDVELDVPVMEQIMESGHSRVPVYHLDRANVVGESRVRVSRACLVCQSVSGCRCLSASISVCQRLSVSVSVSVLVRASIIEDGHCCVPADHLDCANVVCECL